MRRHLGVVTSLLVAALAGVACGGGAPPPSGADDRSPADLVLLGGTLVTMDAERRVLDDAGVAVRDGAFVAVGSAAEIDSTWRSDRTIRLGERDIVAPGLVNAHGHAAMTLLRGVADDMQLMDWLENYIFPAEAQTVTEEFVRVGTRLAAMEMIRTGTTTFVDMYYFEQIAAEVVDEVGLRGVLGETIIGFPVPDAPTPADALAYSREFMRRWQGHPRITATVAPHSPYTVDPEVLQQVAELAREFDRPILIHLAETSDEVAQIRERFGRTPTEHLADLGVLGPDLVGAHGIWLSDGDIALLSETGAALAHNPESNMKLASGTMRVPALLSAGVPVGLGTDGAASNNDLDMFGAMAAAALLQKLATGDPTALDAQTVLEMATLGGARALGMEDRIGSIEVGKRADLLVIDGDTPSLVPRYAPVSHLVYAARGGDVRLTMVEGRVLFEDGAYRTLDAEVTLREARALADRIAAVVGLER